MDKRKKIIIIILAIILIVTAIVCVSTRNSSNNNKDKEILNQKEYYTETDTSIIFNSDEPVTGIKEKIININPFQKAQITIDKNQISGDLEIEVIEKSTSNKLNEQIDIETNNEIIKIDEGLGEYIIKIDAQNLSGTYNINWNIQENKNIELYTSTKGYELEYDSSKFQIINENGKEKFKYIQDENDIYFMVEVIESNDISEIKNKMIESGETTGVCKISESKLKGIYTENINENIKNQKMIFEVTETKMIIIEINQYDKMYEKYLIKEHIKNMIKTFRLDGIN